MCIPIHPGKESRQHIEFHTENSVSGTCSLYRLPLEYDSELDNSQQLPGLISLGSFLNNGPTEVPGVRVLVCLRSIGPTRKVKSKKRHVMLEFVEVSLYDNTATCFMKLWKDKIPSTNSWVPNETVLLLTNPRYYSGNKSSRYLPEIDLGSSTLVEINPIFPDAERLREWARRKTKRENVYIPFPRGIWDMEDAINGPVRPLFTIANLDEFSRTNESSSFTGKLNLVILSMGLLEHWRKESLCCREWFELLFCFNRNSQS
jgi:hypothetical protein